MRLGVLILTLRELLRLVSACLILLCVICSSLPRSFAVLAGSGEIAEFTVEAAADNYADSMYPKSAYGRRPVLYVGNSVDRAQNLSGPARIYIQFDLSMIPMQAGVIFAEMSLYEMNAPASALTLETHMVQSAWDESAMNWEAQPSSDEVVISAVQIPAAEDVWVSLNVTSAVQDWVDGGVPNYGLMIRIQNEKTGVANEAFGFWSKQSPNEEVRPKLHVLCTGQPPFTYLFTASVSGMPPYLASMITADDRITIKVPGGGVGYFLFESGTAHTMIADEYVYESDSVRYHANANSTTATIKGEFAFTYNPQFRVTMKSNPPGLVQPERDEWFDGGVRIATQTAQEAFDQSAGKRVVFEGWYVNDVKHTGNPIEYVVAAPVNLTARYILLYRVNASSPFGQASGSGWHPAGSSVEIAVEPTYLPAEGFLGYLGFGTTFDHWTGTVESASSAVEVTVDGPVEERAVWREDRSRLVAGIAVMAAIILIVLVVLRRRAVGSRSKKPSHV